MNIAIIKDEIKWLLEAINEQYDAIHRYGGKIPQIEFDILLENVRKFYENMHILQRLNEAPLPAKTTSEVTVSSNKPEAPVIKPDFSKDVMQSPVSAAPVHFKPVSSFTSKQEQPSTPKKTAKPEEPDLFAPEEPAFNLKLKAAREKTLGPKIPSERIENLKTAITINEKFMFINELFVGNLREYNETIEKLNEFKNINQAGEYLDLLRKKNFWNTGSTAFKKLSELVERRF